MFQIYCRVSIKNYHAEEFIFDKFASFLTQPIFDRCLYSVIVGSAYFVKSTPPMVFSMSFQYFADMVDILQMCMKNYHAEKSFLTNLQHFDLANFR